jgi:hypothetical protein
VSWVVVALFLKEVRYPLVFKILAEHHGPQSLVRTPPPVKINPDITQEVSSGTMDTSQKDTQMPPPLRSLLTRPVLITVANYSALSLLEMTAVALIPLIWSTPVEFGGLDLSPASIGLGMSLCGFMGGIFQFAVFPCLVARFGLRWVLATSVAICAVIFAMFPLENLVMRHAIGGRPNATLWLLIFLQLWSLSIHKMGFGEFFFHFCQLSSEAVRRRLSPSAICQARCLCTSAPPHPRTGGHWAR